MNGIQFAHQEQLFEFMEMLSVLCNDSMLLLLDQSNHLVSQKKWSKDFDATAIDTLIQSQHLPADTQRSIELISKKSGLKPYLHHWQPVRVDETNFSGNIHLLTPNVSTLHTQQPHSVEQASDTSLAALFNSNAPEMKQMFTIIERVAATEFPVLVRGESGSGKELVAKALHTFSQRKNQIFIAINCAALNANILESELFGHVKGAFTGAIRDHKGVFERATGGTLFLDEVAEIPLELQAKLLRVLETGEFTRLGGETLIKTNVRIIAATHRALREEAKQGRFRQDLLYRLRVIPIFVPPLRSRKIDIPLIAKSILHENAFNPCATPPEFSLAAMSALIAYDWPGNVRELKNTILYALTMANGSPVIDLADLPVEILEPEYVKNNDQLADEYSLTAVDIQNALTQNHHNLRKAAHQLGISRTTLWRYRKSFNL